jgi:hypothetical protein
LCGSGVLDNLNEVALRSTDHEMREHCSERLVEKTFIVGGRDGDVDEIVFFFVAVIKPFLDLDSIINT